MRTCAHEARNQLCQTIQKATQAFALTWEMGEDRVVCTWGS